MGFEEESRLGRQERVSHREHCDGIYTTGFVAMSETGLGMIVDNIVNNIGHNFSTFGQAGRERESN